MAKAEDRNIKTVRRARAFIVQNGKVLVCKGKRRYLLGGHAERLEFCDVALCRETLEETGNTCELEDYVGTFEHAYFDAIWKVTIQEVNVIFTLKFAAPLPEQIQSPEEKLELVWLPIDQLEQELLPPKLARLLLEWLRTKKPFYANSGVSAEEVENSARVEYSWPTLPHDRTEEEFLAKIQNASAVLLYSPHPSGDGFWYQEAQIEIMSSAAVTLSLNEKLKHVPCPIARPELILMSDIEYFRNHFEDIDRWFANTIVFGERLPAESVRSLGTALRFYIAEQIQKN